MEGEVSVEELLAESAGLKVLARRLVGGDALDLVQESLLASLQQSTRPRALREWLQGVTRKQAALFWRREGQRSQREEHAAVHERLPSASELAEQAEIHQILAEEVVRLPDPYRSSVILRFYHGLSAQEIAERTAEGLSVAGIRTRVKRGVAMLRQRLQERYGGRREDWMRALVPALLLPGVNSTSWRWPWRKLAMGALLTASAASAYLVLRDPSPGEQRRVLLSVPEVVGELRSAESHDSVHRSSRQRVELSGRERAVTLRFVDSFDLEPLVDLGVAKPGGERRWTDAQGRVDWQLAPGTRELELELLDERSGSEGLACELVAQGNALLERTRIQVGVEEAGDVVSVQLEVGPTYFLELDPQSEGRAPIDPSRFQVHLTRADAATKARRHCPDYAPLRASAEKGVAWVRFPPLDLGEVGPWTLEVFDEQGTWYGRANVSSVRGTHPLPLPITLEPRAALHLHVEGGPVVVDVAHEISLRSLETGDVVERPTSRESGHYRFDALLPGVFELEVRSPVHETWTSEFELRGGEARTEVVRLERSPVSSGVHGELRSESGMFHGDVLVRLESATGANAPQFVHPEWMEQHGEWVGRFSFAAVPPGEYDIEIGSYEDLAHWEPRSLRVDAPAMDLFFECGDAVDRAQVEIDLGPDFHGSARLFFRVDGGEQNVRRVLRPAGEDATWGLEVLGTVVRWGHGMPILRGVPVGAEVAWAVEAPGFRPRSGTLTVRDPWMTHTVDAALSEGFGIALRILAEERPFEGARVFFDGVELARTDARGVASAFALQSPQLLRIEAGDRLLEGPPASLLEAFEYRDGVREIVWDR